MITKIFTFIASGIMAIGGFLGIHNTNSIPAPQGSENIPLGASVFNTNQGGTGTSTLPTQDQILIGGDTANRYDVKTLTAGSNITIATTSGKVTISSTGGAGNSFAWPFTANTGYVSTSTTLGLLNGYFSTASSTQSGNFFLPALTQGFLYTGSAGQVNTIASSSIKLSWFNNDAGFVTTSGFDFPNVQSWGNATSTTLGFLNGFISTASSTFGGQVFFPASSAGAPSIQIGTAATGIWNQGGGSAGYIRFANAGTESWAITSNYDLIAVDSGATLGVLGNGSVTMPDINSWQDTNTGFAWNNSDGIIVTNGGAQTAQFRTNGLLFDYSSSTIYSSFKTASSTNYLGAGLQACDPTTGKLTWANGQFGCGTDFNTGGSSVAGVDFPNVQAWGNSTSTALGFLNGFLSTASSTISSALRLSSLSQGSAYIGSGGLVNTVGTSTPSVTAPITYSGTLGQFIGGASGAFDCTSASAGVKGCITAADYSKFGSATTTFSTGLTYTLGTNAVTVNTSQNIATLSNLTSNGYVKTSGGVGTLGVQAVPIPIADGGTNATTYANNTLMFFDGTRLVATTSQLTTGTILATTTWGVATSTFLQAVNIGTGSISGNMLKVTAPATTSASVTTGGALNVTQAFDGAGLVVNKAGSASDTGRGIVGNCTGTLSPQDCVHIDIAGAGDGLSVTASALSSNAVSITSAGLDHTLRVAYTGSASNIGAVAFTSTNNATVVNVTGAPAGQGIIKCSGSGAGDTDASCFSTDTSTNGFLGQNLFIKGNNSNKIWNIRNADNAELSTFMPGGYLGIGTTTPNWGIEISTSTKPQLALSDAGTNIFTFRTTGLGLAIGSTSPTTYATNTPSQVFISNSGFGTTTLLGLNITGQATTTSNVGENITTGCYAINGTCISGGAGGGMTSFIAGAGLLGGTITNGQTIYAQVGTSSIPTVNPAGLAYWTDLGTASAPAKLGSVATGTASCTTGASCTSFTVIGSSPSITTTLGTSITPDELSGAPSSPNALLALNSAGTGFVATSTHPLYVGQIFATSTASASQLLYASSTSLTSSSYSTFGGFNSTASSTVGGNFTAFLGANGIAQLNDASNASAVWGTNVGWISTGGNGIQTTSGSANMIFDVGGTRNTMTTGSEVMRINRNFAIGIGTTTAFRAALSIATGTASQLRFTDPSTPNLDHWDISNVGGVFKIGTSSPVTFATSTTYAISIGSNNIVSFGNSNATCIALTGSAGLCDGGDAAGGAGGDGDFTWASTFGTLSAATNTPVWLQSQLFGSSTVTLGTAGKSQFRWDSANGRLGIGTLSPAEILHLSVGTGEFGTFRLDSGATQGYMWSYDGDNSVNFGSNSTSQLNFKMGNATRMYIDNQGFPYVQNSTGNHSWFTLDAPSGDPQEATFTNRIGTSANGRFTDYTIENYGTDLLSTINIAKTGTGTIVPFGIRFWNADVADIAANGKFNFLTDPIGGTAIGSFSTTTYNPWTMLQIASSTATTTLAIQSAAGTSQFLFNAPAQMAGFGTTTPLGAVLSIASTTKPQLKLSGGNTDDAWNFRSIGNNLYIGTSSPTTFATTSIFTPFNIGSTGTSTIYDLSVSRIATLATTILTKVLGSIDMGDATSLEIPNGTTNTMSAIGQEFYDSSDKQLLIATSTNNDPGVIPLKQKLWSGTIASTSVDFVSGGRIPLNSWSDGVVITEIQCFVDGGTSKVINIDSLAGGVNTDSVTCATTNTKDTAMSANYIVAAETPMAIELGASVSTPDYVTFSVWGYIQRE